MKMRRNFLGMLFSAALVALGSGNAIAADKVSLSFSAGTESNKDGLYYATLDKLSKELKARTDDQIKIRIYPNQQLGTEASMVEGLRSGSVDIAIVGGGNFASFVEEFQLFSVPYIFADYDAYRKAMLPDNDVWKLMLGAVTKANLGLRVMAPTTVGSRWVANTKGTLTNPDDFKKLGLRMRVQANPIEGEVWSLFGAQPVNMAMPEVVAAMRQGVLQAVENAPDILYTYKLHEVAKHLTQTDHSFYVALVLMSDQAWNKIPENLRPAVQEAFDVTGQYVLDLSQTYQEKAVAAMKAEGAVVTQADKAAFRKPLEPLYDRVAKEVHAEDLLSAIRAL